MKRTQAFKLAVVGLFASAAIVYGLIGSPVEAFSTGPPASRTGAPALGTFPLEPTCTLCHTTFPLNSGPGVVTITGLPAAYTPNQEVAVTVTVTQADRGRYGFEATVLDDQGRKAGDLIVTDTARMRTIDGTGNYAGRQYIQHIIGGVTPTGMNQGSFTFTWRAPATSVGRVTFFVAGNAANLGNGNQQDFIYNISRSVQASGGLPIVSAATFETTGSVGADSIASVFGMGLADGMAAASGLPLPTTLAGAMVRFRDSAGTESDAPLFFAGPTQVNFMIPRNAAAGVATINVRRGGNTVGSGTITVEAVAPGLFAANANGMGPAAAVIFRRRANGMESYEPAVQFNQAMNRFDAVPIDLGPEGDQVFFIGFGTGLRGRTGNSNLALIGGATALVNFVGAQGQLEGVDQTNIAIPRSLAARGNVDVLLTVDGKRTNAVTINIR